jgi:hypothetical protein
MLKKPQRMMMLIMAGKPVDDFIELLLNEGGIEKGDIIIDGGNSHYPDTNRRTEYLAQKAFALWALVFPEEKRVLDTAPASCLVATRRPGHMSK